MGDVTATEVDACTALALDPEFAEAYYWRAMARCESGYIIGAAADMRTCLEKLQGEDLKRVAQQELDYIEVYIFNEGGAAAAEASAAREAQAIRLANDAKAEAAFLSVAALATVTLPLPSDAQTNLNAARDLQGIEEAAREAYAKRDFRQTLELVDELVAAQPDVARWHEMRAAVRVDGKQFESALTDFDQAISATPGDSLVEQARLLAGRALAYEGLAQWEAALGDYNRALDLARQAGQYPDPYVLNSRGNVQASLAHWKEARQDYLKSAAGFQKAAGFRDSSGSSALRLDGAVVAASNAALALVQLGDEPAAILEMRKALRRAPGSADLRAALAALYWSQGNEAAAESEWNFACERISVGCSKYQDKDWLTRIRRWPPSMVDRMTSFLALASSKRIA
ncbi:hypothetical protein WJX75_005609 [Coccomyxa subellipsoidea]|uniref:TPR-like protein n=1 Tax=Coccomyxa subellipsoidea TaxID=248742 RepID=A0ABR2Z3W3_9CHLO